MSLYHLSARALRYGLFSLLVGTALAFSALRFWVIPNAAHYREQLEARLGAELETPVRIDSLGAHMHGFNPVLSMDGVAILGEDGLTTALSLKRIGVELSLWSSVLARRPVFGGLELEGARLLAVRREDGSFGIAGLRGGGKTPAWLLDEGEIGLRGISLAWRDDLKHRGPLELGQIDLRLVNSGETHRVRVDLALPSGLGESLTILAEMRGDPLSGPPGSGRAYVDGVGVSDLSGLPLEALPVSLRAGRADFRLWLEWQQGELRRAAGSVDLQKAVLSSTVGRDEQVQLGLDGLRTHLDWRAHGHGFELELSELRLDLLGSPWPSTQLALAVERNPEGEIQTVRGGASFLRLEDLGYLARGLPGRDEPWRRTLEGQALHGEAREFRGIYDRSQGQAPRWAVCGQLRGLGAKAFGGLPGLEGVDLQGCGSPGSGRLSLGARDGSFEFARLWERPIRLSRLDGEFNWSADGTGWRLGGEHLALDIPGARLSGRFETWGVAGGARSPYLDLQATLDDTDAASLSDYLPLAAMPQTASQWLGKAFVKGRVRHGDILFHGGLGDFPFDRGEGVFEALVEAEKIELDFDPEWPHLIDADAQLRFFNRGMSIDARSGAIGAGKIRQAHAEIGDFVREDWLSVNGQVDSDVPGAMGVLLQSPLRRLPDRLLAVVRPSGDAAVNLDLRIPLVAGIGDVRVRGGAQLSRGGLEFLDLDQSLSELSGLLEFSNAGLKAKGLRAKFLNRPIELDVSQKGENIAVDASASLDKAALDKALPSALWARAEGELDCRLHLELPQSMDLSGSPVSLSLESDLAGLGLDFPAPLGKARGQHRRLRADLVIGRGNKLPLRIGYGEELKAHLNFIDGPNGYTWAGADLAVGHDLPPVPSDKQIRLRARMERLELSPWMDLLGLGEGKGLWEGPALGAVDLNLKEVSWKGRAYGGFSLQADRSGEAWAGRVSSAFGQGKFSLSTPLFSRANLSLDMDFLAWPELGDAESSSSPSEGINPESLPALQLSSRQTFWHGKDLGALKLDAERWMQGFNLRHLSLGNANQHLEGQGSWMRREQGQQTRFKGTLNVKDLGALLGDLGYGKEIRETPTQAEFDLQWDGPPHGFSAASLTGDLGLALGRGSILKMEPGLSRALGVLNLDTLRRLLVLDFSDLFGKGFGYDSMEGRFRFTGGQAETKGFLIDAVAAKILIVGRIGLVSRDFDQTVSVIPHTLATLPLAGAYAPGAAVGMAVDAAQQLFGGDGSHLASNNYKISGSWSKPEVTKIAGNLPLDVLNRAWQELKSFSGVGGEGKR